MSQNSNEKKNESDFKQTKEINSNKQTASNSLKIHKNVPYNTVTESDNNKNDNTEIENDNNKDNTKTNIPQTTKDDEQNHRSILRQRIGSYSKKPQKESHRERVQEVIDELQEADESDEEYAPTETSLESFTLRDKQDAINETHPFGIRIWKPALYKKLRSVQKNAEEEIHSAPGKKVGMTVRIGNFLWTITFGLFFFVLCTFAASSFVIIAWSSSAWIYAKVLFNTGVYLFNPFGRYVQLIKDDNYAYEDAGLGLDASDYLRWQAGEFGRGGLFFSQSEVSLRDNENSNNKKSNSKKVNTNNNNDNLFNSNYSINNNNNNNNVNNNNNNYGSNYQRTLHQNHYLNKNDTIPNHSNESDPLLPNSSSVSYNGETSKRRFFGRGAWTVARILFYLWFYIAIVPFMLTVAALCFLGVFSLPMSKVLFNLTYNLRRHPLALRFHAANDYVDNPSSDGPILLCTYRAFGLKYYKYTVDGTNIFLVNLTSIVIFTIFDFFVLHQMLKIDTLITSSGAIFLLSLLSVIPLAYFIGQAVASISAQSSMGMGAAINAFFSTVVEVFLYTVALRQGKGLIVEGSIIGSVLGGILLMPGTSMIGGALYRKTQKYNPRSAGVSSTMLLFAIVAVFAPTLFYQIYGTYELKCTTCDDNSALLNSEIVTDLAKTICRKCHFFQKSLLNDDLYKAAVKPLSYVCSILLFVSYVIGLWFTLRTHAAIIWQTSSTTAAPTSDRVMASSQTRASHFQLFPGDRNCKPSEGHANSGSTHNLKGYSNANTSDGVSHGVESFGNTPRRQHSISENIAISLYRKLQNNQVSPDSLMNKSQAKKIFLPSLSDEENEKLTKSTFEIAASIAANAVNSLTNHIFSSVSNTSVNGSNAPAAGSGIPNTSLGSPKLAPIQPPVGSGATHMRFPVLSSALSPNRHHSHQYQAQNQYLPSSLLNSTETAFSEPNTYKERSRHNSSAVGVSHVFPNLGRTGSPPPHPSHGRSSSNPISNNVEQGNSQSVSYNVSNISNNNTFNRHSISHDVATSGYPGGDGNKADDGAAASGGHDAPNWSRPKSTVILLGATILYAIIAEILVDTVDVVLTSIKIDPKFLGITLIALVPCTTEFLNAISFAMHGNIALSMEISTAYVLQVCLLQIPALVLISYFIPLPEGYPLREFAFPLIFPRWDAIVVILCVFVFSYIYAEGTSNYFKGTILVCSYIVVISGFYFSAITDEQLGNESDYSFPLFMTQGMFGN